jgi:hypothetical protein
MKAVVFALWLLLPVACAQLPELRPVRGTSPFPADICDHVFPQGDWQFLHVLEATPPSGDKQTLLGLSQLSSTRKTGKFVIMTIEGMVLFEAHVDDGIDVKRAVPPFDRPGMAQGIVDDLRLIFFAPDPSTRITGALDNGDRVCRFALPGGGTQDIEVHSDAGWTIYQYNRSNRITRSVQPVPSRGRSVHGMPNQLILDAPGPVGYRLIITLLEAEPLPRPLHP